MRFPRCRHARSENDRRVYLRPYLLSLLSPLRSIVRCLSTTHFAAFRVLLGLCCTGYYKLSVKQNTNGTLLICIYSRICRKWIDKRTYRFYLFLLYLIIFLNNIFSHFFVILIKFSSFFHMKKEKFSIIFYNVIKWRTVFWCIVPEDLSLFQQFLVYFRNGNLMTLWLPARIVANKIVTHFKFLQFV